MLLANRINHPAKEMHELFAEELFRMILGASEADEAADNNTMYREKE